MFHDSKSMPNPPQESNDNEPPVSHRAHWSDSLVREVHDVAAVALGKERKGHTLQPTALVNEAFMVLLNQRQLNADDRAEFLAAAANTIRRILVDHARRRNAVKRGGNFERVSMDVSLAGHADELEILSLHEALEELNAKSSRAANVVEMKFFGGMTGDEIAAHLGVSLRTVNNDWSFAKAWLYRELKRKGETR